MKTNKPSVGGTRCHLQLLKPCAEAREPPYHQTGSSQSRDLLFLQISEIQTEGEHIMTVQLEILEQ